MTPSSSNENLYHHRPHPSRTGVRRLRLELLLAFHSRAAAVARPGWGLFQGFPASGYIYVVGALQLLSGLLLLIGRFVPLGLTILAAIIVNIWLSTF